MRRLALGAMAAVLVCPACSRRPAPQPRPLPPSEAVAIVRPVVSNRVGQAAFELVRAMFPRAPLVSADGWMSRLADIREKGVVLIIADAARLPVSAWTELEAFLADGGRALILGCDPFEERVVSIDGALRTAASVQAELAASAMAVSGFSEIQAWRHANNTAALKGSVRIARDPALPWPGVVVEAKGLDRWDRMSTREADRASLAGTDNTLVFYAMGGESVSRLTIEAAEVDGSAWQASVPVTPRWSPAVLHERLFEYRGGGDGRGGPGDHFALSRVRDLSIGLSAETAAIRPGDHVFGLSDVRVAADIRSAAEIVEWPDIPIVSPPVRRYEFHAPTVQSVERGDAFEAGTVRLQSPFPRERGMGGSGESAFRWIPLFSATDAAGRICGWPASVCIRRAADGSTGLWAWIGVDATERTVSFLRPMVAECVSRLADGLFLLSAGAGSFAMGPNEDLVVRASAVTGHRDTRHLRVRAELEKVGARYPARKILEVCRDDGQAVEINLGRTPRLSHTPEDYVLRVSLEDARETGRAYDRIEQPLKFLPELRRAASIEWTTAAGPRFVQAGRTFFPLGTVYAPQSAVGRAAGETAPRWLDSEIFDPELIRRDLDRLEEAGVNAVAIPYSNERQAPQVRYFVEEAKKRGIWVELSVEDLNPIRPDLGKARRMLDAANVSREPRIFALNLAWDARLGNREERRAYDEAWTEWIQEQFGSAEHAERVLGCPLWRDGGRLAGPPDHVLTENGPQRPAVEAYRRFVDDFVSRRYGWIVRTLRSWGIQQLVGAPAGGVAEAGDADALFPLDPASGAAHLDFMSPDGRGLVGSAGRFHEAGFITAYARGVSGGKPVLWTGFGASVGREPAPADLAAQAGAYDNLFGMAVFSRAAGCIGSWFPGGYSEDLRSDRGIVNADGTWRPVMDAYRRTIGRLRADKGVPAAWRGREVSRGADARGWPALWDAWKEEYRQATAESRVEEIRPVGFGKRTGELVVKGPAGVPFGDPSPMESVNAEWGGVDIDGQPADRKPGEPLRVGAKQKLRLELINTGSATWDASERGKRQAVWVSARDPRGGEQLLPVTFVPFGERAVILWVAAETGAWQLRPVVAGVGGFGEPLRVVVSP